MKIICIEYKNIDCYCSMCGSRMWVKEKYLRSIKHSILQDGFQLIIEYTQRSWVCPKCKKRFTPHVHFVSKYKQFSNITTYLAVNKLSELSLSVRMVSDDFGMSDTALHNFFLQHVDLKRLPLPKVLSIDEVYTNFRDDCKYSLVLIDFFTHDIIDILPSRRDSYTNPYFLSIPPEERSSVKYIISDMYTPYADYTERYFRSAQSAIDSFHVISWLLNKIRNYLRVLIRKYNNDKTSDEYYLLKYHQWIILKNEDNITDIQTPKKIDRHFRCYMSTSSYMERFFKIHPDLEKIHSLKEDYIDFNNKNHVSLENLKSEFDTLIIKYRNSDLDIFIEFSNLLLQNKDAIINSFIVMPSLGKSVRLSNGAIESFNRKPKDLKRLARGVENFEFFRQRVLFSERAEKVILAAPKPFKEIQNKTNRKRGKYKKHKL